MFAKKFLSIKSNGFKLSIMNRKSRKDRDMCKGTTKDDVVNEVTTTSRIDRNRSHNGLLLMDERTLWGKKER